MGVTLGAAPASTPQLLQQAFAAYNSGDRARSEHFCRLILRTDPQCFDAVNLLGVIAAQTRRLSEAASMFQRAVAIQPADPGAYNNYANALKELKRLEEACENYAYALRLKPSYVEAHFNRGIALHELKRLEEAAASFSKAIQLQPRYAEAHCNLGNVLQQRSQPDAALASYERALALRPDYLEALYNRANILQEMGRSPEALAAFERVLQLREDVPEAHYNRANILHQLGRFEEALKGYERALKLKPQHADAECNRGNSLQELQRFDEALLCYQRTLRIDPRHAVAYFNRGNAQRQLGQPSEALASYERALSIKPAFIDAHHARGEILRESKRPEEALSCYERILELHPGLAEAHNKRGSVLKQLARLPEALESYDRALSLQPEFADAYNNRGNALQDLHRFEEALEDYQRALQIDPAHAVAWNNRGNVLQQLRRYDEALASYEQALRQIPDYANALINRGQALKELGQIDEAVENFDRALWFNADALDAHAGRAVTLSQARRYEQARPNYERALELDPEYEWLPGSALHNQMQMCHWSGWQSKAADLASRIERGTKATPPFPLLALLDSLPLQRRVAERWAQAKYPENHSLGPIPRRTRRERIRVGYFSGDFRDHPVSTLIAEILERHSRSGFEVYGFSFGADTGGEMRERIRHGTEHFIDVRTLGDREMALLAREVELDIAVDLGGYTDSARPRVFAMRAAPMQVSYLGYLGTLGAKFMDYIFADSVLIPADSRQHYVEKIAYLPSYQPNDTKRVIADGLSRQEFGLPPSQFVFCCFNAVYKITPPVFDSWMRILGNTPSSVLFLLAESEAVHHNLRAEAQQRGVSPDRLIFAGRVAFSAYLARYRAADLFLDTAPYNAGTTAADALWAGLPVLTCIGESFAARMAASLLTSVGLPELVATTREQYETLAVQLASDPAKLADVRAKLSQARSTTRLFDAERMTRSIEGAYRQMYERYQAGLDPDHFTVG
jgi:predicted O-linked N-acetylglucosamine transferase (SPINDLY family)